MSDENLLESACDKQKVLQIIYERYGHLVLGLCIKYLKNKTQAEDLAMEIFEGLMAKTEKQKILHFKSWLYQVSKNQCLMALRKNKVHFTEINEDSFKSETDEINHIEKEANLVLLEEAIDELKSEQKACIIGYYLEKKSYRVIATELEISEKQVKSFLQNGKRNLKNKLDI